MTAALARELMALCTRHGVVATVGAALEVLAPELPEAGVDLRQVVTHVENHLLVQALKRAHGNKSHAAALLRLNRTTLVEKLKAKLDTDEHFRALFTKDRPMTQTTPRASARLGALTTDPEIELLRAKARVCDAYRVWLGTPVREHRLVISAALEELQVLEERRIEVAS